MEIKLASYLTGNEIIINDKKTYPKIIRTYCESILKYENFTDTVDGLLQLLKNNNFEIVCFHLSRFTDKEIESIKVNGLENSDKELFIRKIQNMDCLTNMEKNRLLKHVEGLKYTQVDGGLCCKIGTSKINDRQLFQNDLNCFIADWGGETIYNYYETHKNQSVQQMRTKINENSKPQICILKIKFYSIPYCDAHEICTRMLKYYCKASDECDYTLVVAANHLTFVDCIDFNINDIII